MNIIYLQGVSYINDDSYVMSDDENKHGDDVADRK